MKDIIYFLVQTVLSLLGIAFIIRAWLFFIRMPPFNPYSRAIFQFTDWAITPLRKIISPRSKFDWPSLIATWLCAIFSIVIGNLLITGSFLPLNVIAALLIAIKWVLNIALWLVILQVIMSWINPSAPAMAFIHALTRPMIDPIRQRLPATGALDFSPLVLLLIIQVLNMVVQKLTVATLTM